MRGETLLITTAHKSVQFSDFLNEKFPDLKIMHFGNVRGKDDERSVPEINVRFGDDK